ncbi:MAG: hypothetical protein RR232_00755 [Clostridia bacterium]
MKIFGILEQIEETVEDSPKPKLGGGNRRVVDADEIFDLLGDLKVTIPEDIRRANSVIVEAKNITSNADDYARDTVQKAQADAEKIIADADERAEQIMIKTKEECERLISEEEIYKEAQRRAQLLAAKAEYNANCVYEDAKVYADEVLVDLERFIAEYDQMIKVNRRDLGARAQQSAQPVVKPSPTTDINSGYAERRRPPVKRVEPTQEDVYEEERFDEDDRGSFLGLFKRRKKAVDNDDFIDEEF